MNGYSCSFKHVGAEAEALGLGSESRSPSSETEAEAESEAKAEAEAEGTGMGAVGCVLGSLLAALVRRGIPGIAYKGCDHSSSSHSKQASSAIDSRLTDRKLHSQEQNGAYCDLSFFRTASSPKKSCAGKLVAL